MILAESDKKKSKLLESAITPIVTLRYAYLTKVDDKYGIFSVQGLMDPEADPKHKAFVDQTRSKAQELVSEMLSKVDEKKRQYIQKNYKLELPIKDELVDYKPTGKLVLKAKSNKDHPPSVFVVADGKLVATTKIVWSGSTGEIKILLNPYVCDAQKTYGVSFLLSAVKVAKFATGRGSTPGAAIGFSADADTTCDAPSAVPSETPPTDSGSDTEGDDTGSF
jgi:hypothetical protein